MYALYVDCHVVVDSLLFLNTSQIVVACYPLVDFPVQEMAFRNIGQTEVFTCQWKAIHKVL